MAGGDGTRRPGQVPWCRGARRRGGAGRGHREDRLLTVSTGSLAARPEVAGNAGERWWPGAEKTARFRRFRRPREARVDEEASGNEAELLGYPPVLGGGRNGGIRRRPELLHVAGVRVSCGDRARGGK
jgi:hypothetical protein